MTGNDVIVAAMLRINAVSPGENPSAPEAATALATLNDMLDAWQIERLMIPYMQRLYFALTPTKQSYTVGLGGDLNIPRPARIERMGIINLSNANQPLELPLEMLTEAQWLLTPVKAITSSLPRSVWDDQGFPFRTLTFWPYPSVPVGTTLYVWASLGSFQDLATDYEFPPGYAEAIKYNLAYRISDEFGGFMPPTLPQKAQEAKARIKALNTPMIDLRCDPALVGNGRRMYNWITDQPAGTR